MIEKATKWILRSVSGIVTVNLEVSKKDCSTFEELKAYIDECGEQ